MEVPYRVWHEFTQYDLDLLNQNKKLDYSLLFHLILTKSCFKYAKAYPRILEIYVYSPELGFYHQFNTNELKSLIMQLLMEINQNFCHPKVLGPVYRYIMFGPKSLTGLPQFSTDVFVFNNGTYDFRTNSFRAWSPSDFVKYGVDYPYIPEAQCPSIFSFLENLCGFFEDRVHFLRCWLWTLIRSYRDAQIFLYIQGPGGTGKSVFAHLASALVGRDAVVTTSLKTLNNDPFEVPNLVGKKLISIVDSNFYKGDIGVLKMLSGNDALMGRIKYAQGSFDVHPPGLVLIVSNFPLGSLDTSGAIMRRLRLLPAESKVNSDLVNPNLLTLSPQGYCGTLVNELPGLFCWVNSLTKNEVYKTLSQLSLPSTETHVNSSAEELNPFLRWAKCELEVGEGSYLGCRLKSDIRGEQEFQRRKPLYPAYERWCRREGVRALSGRLFSLTIADVLCSLGFDSKNIRKQFGKYVTGVQLKGDVFSRDYDLGAPITDTLSRNPESTNTQPTSTTLDSTSLTSSGNQLYESYIRILEPTDLKLSLNKESRAIKLDLNALANDYCKGCTIKSTAYVEGVNKVLTRGYSQIKNFGAIPFTYKQMGVSPRIVPNSYKDSVQSVKKFLRDRIYNHLSIYSQREFNYSIIDLDIKSCYISILLGLYPEDLGIVQRAMEQGGLWNFIKDEFEHQGQGSLYNKPLAKICVYSSLFQGGIKAMVNGILEHFRKEVGLSPKEFRESEMFQDAYKIANDNAYLLNNSQIINSFRALSQQVLDTYKGGQLVGPTKHCYSVGLLLFF